MERANILDNFIENWNADFPNYVLTAADLNKPIMLIGALLNVCERLGIDRDAVLAPPPEESRNESTSYYWDLLPVINMTRVINHLVMHQANITITVTHFLQPTAVTSHSILLLQFNLMMFYDERLREIAPFEEQLFEFSYQVKALEDRKHKLLEQLNEQAEEKGKRAEKMEKLNYDIKQFDEELKQEKEMRMREENQELEEILKNNAQTKIIYEQKRTHYEALMAEVARLEALRVYDADDIKAKAAQATQNVQEAEQKLNSLQSTLMEKENSLKNLQSIKPSLDQAKNFLDEIMNLTESLKQSESGDLDTDSLGGELEVLNMDVSELIAQLAEKEAVRATAEAKYREGQARRQREIIELQMALQDAEEKDRESQELYKKAIQRTEDIKQLTYKYREEKSELFAELAKIIEDCSKELEDLNEELLGEFEGAQKCIEEKLKNRNIF